MVRVLPTRQPQHHHSNGALDATIATMRPAAHRGSGGGGGSATAAATAALAEETARMEARLRALREEREKLMAKTAAAGPGPR